MAVSPIMFLSLSPSLPPSNHQWEMRIQKPHTKQKIKLTVSGKRGSGLPSCPLRPPRALLARSSTCRGRGALGRLPRPGKPDGSARRATRGRTGLPRSPGGAWQLLGRVTPPHTVSADLRGRRGLWEWQRGRGREAGEESRTERPRGRWPRGEGVGQTPKGCRPLFAGSQSVAWGSGVPAASPACCSSLPCHRASSSHCFRPLRDIHAPCLSCLVAFLLAPRCARSSRPSRAGPWSDIPSREPRA